jgi:lipopolysaccharide exporter
MHEKRAEMTQVRVAVILPAEERFDGTGGAVATWVRNIYQSPRLTGTVYSPSSSGDFAGDIAIGGPRWYTLFDRLTQFMAWGVAVVLRKSARQVYVRLIMAGRVWAWAVARTVRAYDVAHIHNRPAYAVALRKRSFSGKIILHMHNDLSSYVTPLSFPDIVSSVDHFVFCSEFLASKAIEQFGDLPHSVLYNGVETTLATASPRTPKTRARLISAGRISEQKGTDRAVRICRALNLRGFECTLDIYGGTGSGTDNERTKFHAELRAMIVEYNKQLGRQAITLHGPVSHTDLLEQMSRSDIFLYPCRWEEPFGMVVAEAMSVGAVPVATWIGGIPEIVASGTTGILVRPSDSDGPYIEAVENLLSDSDLKNKLSLNAQSAMTERFGWSHIRDDLVAVLDAVVARRDNRT